MSDRKEQIDKITAYIRETIKDQKDAPGIVLIPSIRTDEQLERDEPYTTGLFTNITDEGMFALALLTAVKAYVVTPAYGKNHSDKTNNLPKNDKVALFISQLYTASLSDVDDYARHLSANAHQTVKALSKGNREVTMSILPTEIENGFSAFKNSGMTATASPNKQKDIFATMILAYCVENELDIEQFVSEVFRRVMTYDVHTGTEED